MSNSFKFYMSKNVPKKDTIDGTTQELVTENGIKTYVDTTSSGGGGTSDHSALSNLDYASAGHTGFSPDTHTHTESQITDLEHDAIKIRGRAVASTAPTDGQSLAWNDASSNWAPATVSGGSGGGIQDTDSVEWKKQQYFDSVSLTVSGTTVSWDLETKQFASLSMAGNYTLSNPTNAPTSGRGNYILIVKQDSTGGRTLSFGSNYKFSNGNAPTLSTESNAVDVLTFIYDDVSGYMYGTAKLNLK